MALELSQPVSWLGLTNQGDFSSTARWTAVHTKKHQAFRGRLKGAAKLPMLPKNHISLSIKRLRKFKCHSAPDAFCFFCSPFARFMLPQAVSGDIRLLACGDTGFHNPSAA
jgi:hypothetical protein